MLTYSCHMLTPEICIFPHYSILWQNPVMPAMPLEDSELENVQILYFSAENANFNFASVCICLPDSLLQPLFFFFLLDITLPYPWSLDTSSVWKSSKTLATLIKNKWAKWSPTSFLSVGETERVREILRHKFLWVTESQAPGLQV